MHSGNGFHPFFLRCLCFNPRKHTSQLYFLAGTHARDEGAKRKAGEGEGRTRKEAPTAAEKLHLKAAAHHRTSELLHLGKEFMRHWIAGAKHGPADKVGRCGKCARVSNSVTSFQSLEDHRHQVSGLRYLSILSLLVAGAGGWGLGCPDPSWVWISLGFLPPSRLALPQGLPPAASHQCRSDHAGHWGPCLWYDLHQELPPHSERLSRKGEDSRPRAR